MLIEVLTEHGLGYVALFSLYFEIQVWPLKLRRETPCSSGGVKNDFFASHIC